MKAPRLRSLVVAGLLAVFPASVADLPGVGGCPHHDGAGHARGSVASHGSAPAVHASHGPHAPPPGLGPPAEGADEVPSLCTCIGHCHAGGAVPHPDGRATLRVADGVRALREPRPEREHLPGPVAYLLPYANAPPPA